jgi:hypothetical protein
MIAEVGNVVGNTIGNFLYFIIGNVDIGNVIGECHWERIGNMIGNIIGNVTGNSIGNVIGNIPIMLSATHIEVHPKVQITPKITEFFYISKYKTISCISRQ